MDGVPIGRKVDLNAYDSYEKLASGVDELFRGLLAGTSITSFGYPLNLNVETNYAVGTRLEMFFHSKKDGNIDLSLPNVKFV